MSDGEAKVGVFGEWDNPLSDHRLLFARSGGEWIVVSIVNKETGEQKEPPACFSPKPEILAEMEFQFAAMIAVELGIIPVAPPIAAFTVLEPEGGLH